MYDLSVKGRLDGVEIDKAKLLSDDNDSENQQVYVRYLKVKNKWSIQTTSITVALQFVRGLKHPCLFVDNEARTDNGRINACSMFSADGLSMLYHGSKVQVNQWQLY